MFKKIYQKLIYQMHLSSKEAHKNFIAILITILPFALDSIFKYVANQQVNGTTFWIFSDWFGTGLQKNYGISFSFLSHLPELVIVLNVVLIFVPLLCMIFSKQLSYKIGLAFVLVGALSNLFDRIFYGYVTDYVMFRINNIILSFNLADLMIIFGIFYFTISLIISLSKHE